MAYPGDQQQPGGWPPSPPPKSPYAPADDQAAHGGSLFEPSHGSDRSRRSDTASPFGGPEPYDPASASGAEHDGYGAGPGRPDDEPGGHGTGSPAYGGYGEPSAYGGYAGYGDANGFDDRNRFPDPGGYGAPGGYGEPGGYGAPYHYADEPGGPGAGGPGHGGGDDGGGGWFAANRKLVLIGAGVAAGVVVIGGVAFALSSGGGGDKPEPTAASTQAAPPRPTPTPTPTPTETGRGNLLASRTTDPLALTLNEVFKNKKFRGGGRTYVMTTRRSLKKCSEGVHGTTFRKALAKAGCTQVLRATFSNGKFVGTIGVLNLRTETTAAAAERASHPKDAYIVPLPGVGTTKKIGQGLSLTTAETDGHYLILSWVQYPSGKKISKGDYADVTSFVQYTTLGSNLRPALNYRSMDGKPA